MSYYDSSKGQQINKARAIKELENHGVVESEIKTFLKELGDRESYKASEALEWLGY